MLFVDWFTPGFKGGGPIQSCRNFVEAFKSDFLIYVVTSDRDLGDTAPYPGLLLNTWIPAGDAVQVYYASANNFGRHTMKELIRNAQPDYIYLNSMFSFRFTILPLLLATGAGCQTVLAPRGMLHAGALQYKRPKKRILIGLLDLLRIPHRVIFHATDEQEKKDVLRYFPRVKKVFIAANFPTSDMVEWVPAEKQAGSLRCIFLSRLSPKKNLLFLLQVLQQLPGTIAAELAIYGEIEDSAYWQKCQEAMANMPGSIKISYCGPVNNTDIFEVYKRYHVFILPTHGENFGHAIFEALLAGKPVIISDQTPWRQLQEKKAGYDISLNNPPLFQEAIQRFAMMAPQEYNEWSHHAAEFARAYRQNNNIKEQYSDVFTG